MSSKKGLGYLINLDIILASICFIILVSITFFGVIMRYFFQAPFVWQEEIQLWLFLWIALFGGSAAFRTKNHIEIEMIVELLPKKAQRVIQVVIYATVIVVLGYLGIKGLDMVQQYAATNKSTFVLSIPSALIYSVVPIGCVLMIANYSFVTFKDFMSKPGASKEELT